MLRILIVVMCACVGVAAMLQPGPGDTKHTYSPALDYAALLTAAQRLQEVSLRFDGGGASTDSLRMVVADTRHAYKRVEWIIAHEYPAFAKTHINGAPLPRINRHGHESSQSAPTGLQVLDELVYEDEPNSTNVLALSDELLGQLGLFAPEMLEYSGKVPVLAEAAQSAVVSMVTLGITGFDTPGSLDGIVESAVVLEALQHAFGQFEGSATHDVAVQCLAAAEYLKSNSDFEQLNRLEFIMAHSDPLYKAFGLLAKDAGTKRMPSARNVGSNGMFARDFLDPYAYARLDASDDSPELQQLGKRLFFDAKLSTSGELSCASCHDPNYAYADVRATSLMDRPGAPPRRNAPSLIGAALADRYFYDLRAFTLEQQAEHVIFDHDEFATDYAGMLTQLGADSSYTAQFATTFSKGADALTRDHLSAALASFVVSLRSGTSRFDAYVRGETGATGFTAAERAGFNLFMGKAACGTCHFAPTFSGLVPPLYRENESEVLGVLRSPLDVVATLDGDVGRAASGVPSENTPAYRHGFKTVSVRNAAVTPPYFHNGAYATLDEVLEFYNHGGGNGLGLSLENQTLASDSLGLSRLQLDQLKAFLITITDR